MSALSRFETLESRTLLAATTVGIYADKPNASESHPTGSGKGVFIVKRATGSTAAALSLKYYVRTTSTAKSGVDFQPLSGSITIPIGKRSAAFNVFPIDDHIDEPNETVVLSLKPVAYTIVHTTGTMTIADNDNPAPPPPPQTSSWFGDARRYRVPIDISAGSFARVDQPVDNTVNFTAKLTALSASGSLVENSIKVVEVSADGKTQVDASVPFQFEKDANYNASSNAAGDLVLLVKNSTSANATRHYQVYFDTTGSYAAPSFTAQVTTTDNDSDEGQTAVKIQTTTATYWLQKENGGFSSIEDTSGNDWLGFNPASGSQSGGEFRGTPNAAYPGGGFHAGFNVGTTSILSSGPLKTTIESTLSVDKQIAGSPFTYKMRYEIYGRFVRATMLQADSAYWFLYEGTPGGSVDSNDSVVRSDGTVTDISTTWNDNDGLGSTNGEEWLYFRDSAVNKYIYYVHDTPDNIKDTYYRMDANGSMTVFGFGRDNDLSDPDRERLTAVNNSFTFGIADGGSDFQSAADVIEGNYKPVSSVIGASAAKPS